MSSRKWFYIKDVLEQYILIFPSLCAFVMFSLVHLEPRYIAAFVVLFWLGLFLAVKLEKNTYNIKLIECVVNSLLVMLMITIGVSTARDVSAWQQNGSKHVEWEIAQGLKELGIKEKDKVATIGYEIPYSPYWARVAKVKIVSEIVSKDADRFWSASDLIKSQVITAFRKTGASVIVTNKLPECCSKSGWQKIKKTNTYAYFL